MAGDCEAFRLTSDDAFRLLASQAHLGANGVNYQMEPYVWKRKSDGVHIINIRKMWEKILLAARAIAAIENPADVCVISQRTYGQRAILKFAAHTGATSFAGRFTPGTFTNQIQKAYREPRLLITTDPRVDHQAITEASYANIPVISLCNTDSPLKLIDISIPCNNKGPKSIGLMWWFLSREVLLIRGKINRNTGFVLEDKDIMPDLYFYRDPEEIEKEEQEKLGRADDVAEQDRWGQNIQAADTQTQQWSGEGGEPAAAPGLAPLPDLTAPLSSMDWAKETQMYSAQGTAAAATGKPDDQWGGGATNTWN